jgi:uncharacterized protein YdeI (YjbR/CyaY-like superfamily)
MKRDERVDAYIARQAEFARPILEHLRSAVHAACPDAEETLKWSAPAFMYKGQILAMMAGFKSHVAFNLWRGSLVMEEAEARQGAMGQFGRIASIDDLPEPAALSEIVQRATTLAAAGVKPKRERASKAPVETPEDLKAALEANSAAMATFEAFSSSSRREYVDWVTEAKRPETRASRIQQAVGWMAEGKKRNWKYETR